MVCPHLDTIGVIVCTIGYSRVCRIQLQLLHRFDTIFAVDASVHFASWYEGDKQSSLPGKFVISGLSIVFHGG